MPDSNAGINNSCIGNFSGVFVFPANCQVRNDIFVLSFRGVFALRFNENRLVPTLCFCLTLAFVFHWLFRMVILKAS